MKATIKEAIQLLQSVDGPTEPVKVDMLPIGDFKEIIEDLGGVMDNEWDTNGWAHDFWIACYIDGVKYCLAGSWYDGDYTLDKELEDE